MGADRSRQRNKKRLIDQRVGSKHESTYYCKCKKQIRVIHLKSVTENKRMHCNKTIHFYLQMYAFVRHIGQ